jgi:hypothetical protein
MHITGWVFPAVAWNRILSPALRSRWDSSVGPIDSLALLGSGQRCVHIRSLLPQILTPAEKIVSTQESVAKSLSRRRFVALLNHGSADIDTHGGCSTSRRRGLGADRELVPCVIGSTG